MICSQCSAENADIAKFCNQCGSAFDLSSSPIELPPIPADARKQKTLNQRFVRIGTLAGRTRAEIESVVGPPSSISHMVDGTLLQWMETRSGFLSASSYHIALSFDANDVCVGVTHEFGA